MRARAAACRRACRAASSASSCAISSRTLASICSRSRSCDSIVLRCAARSATSCRWATRARRNFSLPRLHDRLEALDLVQHTSVLLGDPVDRIHAVQQLVERLGAEQHLEPARAAAVDVQRHEPLRERGLRSLQAPARDPEMPGVRDDVRVDPLELAGWRGCTPRPRERAASRSPGSGSGRPRPEPVSPPPWGRRRPSCTEAEPTAARITASRARIAGAFRNLDLIRDSLLRTTQSELARHPPWGPGRSQAAYPSNLHGRLQTATEPKTALRCPLLRITNIPRRRGRGSSRAVVRSAPRADAIGKGRRTSCCGVHRSGAARHGAGRGGRERALRHGLAAESSNVSRPSSSSTRSRASSRRHAQRRQRSRTGGRTSRDGTRRHGSGSRSRGEPPRSRRAVSKSSSGGCTSSEASTPSRSCSAHDRSRRR